MWRNESATPRRAFPPLQLPKAISDGGLYFAVRLVCRVGGIFRWGFHEGASKGHGEVPPIGKVRRLFESGGACVCACCSDLVKRVSRLGFLTNQCDDVRMGHRRCVGWRLLFHLVRAVEFYRCLFQCVVGVPPGQRAFHGITDGVCVCVCVCVCEGLGLAAGHEVMARGCRARFRKTGKCGKRHGRRLRPI